MTSQLLRKLPITPWNRTRQAARRHLPHGICWHLVMAVVFAMVSQSNLRGDQPPEQSLGKAWQARLDEMLDGFHDWGSFESAGEFWARQNTVQARSGTSRRRKSAGAILKEATWEQMPEPDVDIYDSRPIAVLGPEIQQAVRQEEIVAQQPESSRRLKTDIRTIQPSLSYALRDIDATQLPSDYDLRLDKGEYVARQMSPAVLQWAPTNFYHYPLYFEDPALERYGHAWHPLLQPAVSTGRFAGQLIGLPYQMVLHPVHSRQYALGYYRPGEVAPKKHYQIPWNDEAVVMQTAVVVGLFLILP